MANNCGVPLNGGGSVNEINTQECATSTNPCTESTGCAPTAVVCGTSIAVSSGCSSSSCSSSQCCDNIQRASPAPYYACVPSCPEDHAKNTIYQQFYTTIKSSTAWNIPACANTAVIKVPNLASMLVGSYLWNGNYGYFEVTAVDLTLGQVTIKNNCNDGNEPAGTAVPACTDFIVIDPPSTSGGSSDLYPYVAIDFTAPANGDCLLITVTTVNGLAVGKNVQIGSGTYRVDSIDSNSTITICNDGDGITPGTSVIAKNDAGEYQYPIILIDTNQCTNPAVNQGALLVCDGGVTQPLHGSAVGSVPVLLNTTTNEVEFQIPDFQTRICTELTADLTLVPAQASYVLVVADSTEFALGDIIQIGGRTDRLTVTALPDGTHITGTMYPIPSILETLQEGTSVCQQYCCETLACTPQVTRYSITPTLFNGAIAFGGPDSNVFSVALDSSVLQVTVPSDCPTNDYQIKAFLNVITLLEVPLGSPAGSYVAEVQGFWDSNPVGGRIVWNTQLATSDGFTTPAYPTVPTGDEAAIWTILQLLASGDNPMDYVGGLIVAETVVAAGTVDDLQLWLKIAVPDSPAALDGYGVYLTGHVEVSLIG